MNHYRKYTEETAKKYLLYKFVRNGLLIYKHVGYLLTVIKMRNLRKKNHDYLLLRTLYEFRTRYETEALGINFDKQI